MKQTHFSSGPWTRATAVSAAAILLATTTKANSADSTNRTIRSEAAQAQSTHRLPADVPPVLAVWGWTESDFAPRGYEAHIEMMARHSGVNVLTTTIRAPGKFVTDAAVREQIRRATEYAAQFGIKIAMDLDIRLAREAFREANPDELQEMLRLREVALKSSGQVTFSITGDILGDHYTFNATPYVPLSGRVVRIYAYERTDQGIKTETVQDITSQCRIVFATTNQVTVSIACGQQTGGKTACVMVSFVHLSPDVFAPHLLSFQRGILDSYRDIPLAGACKDEWGFPPCFDGNHPAHNDHWYSPFLAKAYSKRTGGRDLARDCLLMTFGEVGREAERVAALNHFNELCRQRNGAIETDFYDAVKAVWGPDAVVATHATWWPYPDRREFKKNGLDWWSAKRDFAQTDEITPYSVRTSLAKKWSSPLWYNMYYSTKVLDYQAELWAGALTGGRINYHGLWPTDDKLAAVQERYRALLRGGLMRGDCRVRLLNFITRSPLDCPVAVVFGQPCAMNWSVQAYDDVGLALSDALWQAGFPTDLIPTTEIWSGDLTVNANGHVQYGPQCYRSVVLYHPQFESAATAAFFQKAVRGKTKLYRVGDWTQDFDGRSFGGVSSLPRKMVVLADPKTAVETVTKQLSAAGVVPQARADRILGFGDCRSVAPPAQGETRLLDGTHVVVAGVNSAAGDPIQRTIQVRGRPVAVDALGMVAIRMDKRGRIEALAAGGLKSLSADKFKIELPERVDLALWRDGHGRFHGVLQDWSGTVPAPLRKLSQDWLRLSAPDPLK